MPGINSERTPGPEADGMQSVPGKGENILMRTCG
jgi:hypothetical protein